MINKKYIEKILRQEENVQKISFLRTQFSPRMSEFYFFRTFFELFKSENINFECIIKKETKIVKPGDLVTICSIEFYEKGNKDNNLFSIYDNEKLQNDIEEYNLHQGDKGMIESAHALIDIFIGLLEG